MYLYSVILKLFDYLCYNLNTDDSWINIPYRNML